jgi:hypothetical protein
MHWNKIPRRYRKYSRWTVVRNPFTRATSLWWSACRLAHKDQYHFRERCGSEDDFTRFVIWLAGVSPQEREKEPLMQNQTEWLAPVERIRALHLEQLKRDIAKLKWWNPGIEIPQLNTTREKLLDAEQIEQQVIERPSLEELYADSRAREAVLDWAAPDFERFGYSRVLP